MNLSPENGKTICEISNYVHFYKNEARLTLPLECEIVFGSSGAQHDRAFRITYTSFVNLLKQIKQDINENGGHGHFYESITSTPPELTIFAHQSKDVNINGNRLNLRFSTTDVGTFCKTSRLDTLSQYTVDYKRRHAYRPAKEEGAPTVSVLDSDSSSGMVFVQLDILDYGIRLNVKDEETVKVYANQTPKFTSSRARQEYSKLQRLKDVFYTFRLRNRQSIRIGKHRLDITVVRESKKVLNHRGVMVHQPVKHFHESELMQQEERFEVELELFVYGDYNPSEDTPASFETVLGRIMSDLMQYPLVLSKTVKETVHQELSQILQDRHMKEVESMESIVQSYKPQAQMSSLDALQRDIEKLFSTSEEPPFHQYTPLYEKLRRHQLAHGSKSMNELEIMLKKASQMRPNRGKLFLSPQLQSLCLEHLSYLSSSAYTVTDKADGIGMNLFISSQHHGQVFLIDSNDRVYATNLKTSTSSLWGSLLNGEYISTNQNGSRLHVLMVYDIYMYGETDVMSYPFMTVKDMERRETDEPSYTRYGHAQRVLKLAKFHSTQSKHEMHTLNVKMKEFRYFDGKTQPTRTLFTCSKAIWSKTLAKTNEYKYDGLVFTPALLPVGFEATKQLYNFNIGRTWTYNYKWKPPHENTIDFLVQEEKICVYKDSQGHQILKSRVQTSVEHIDSQKVFENYREFSLLVGKNQTLEEISCSSLAETPPVRAGKKHFYLPALFLPTAPFFGKDVGKARLIVNSVQDSHIRVQRFNSEPDMQQWETCQNGEKIQDDTIVEFAYDTSSSKHVNVRSRWKPVRVRHDKTIRYRNGLRLQHYLYQLLQYYLKVVAKLSDRDLGEALQIKKNRDNLFELYKIAKSVNYKCPETAMEILKTLKHNQRLLQERYSEPKFIPVGLKYGNNIDVANNVWQSIHNPISVDMICNGTMDDVQDIGSVYYNRDVQTQSRENSSTYALQQFHNKIVKQTTLFEKVIPFIKREHSRVHLLDLATGKGGDLHKWMEQKLSDVVGIDIVSDNIYNALDGACVRRQQTSRQSATKIHFLVGDVSKNIRSGEAFEKDSRSKKLYSKLWKQPSFPRYHYEEKRFDVVTMMFALHYMFKSEKMLQGFIQNLVQNLKPGGIFMGACLDGVKVFEALRSKSIGESIRGVDAQQRILWKLKKQFSHEQFSADKSSLGAQISVFMPSINKEIVEYLVHFDYLKQELQKHGIEDCSAEVREQLHLPDTDSFEAIFNSMQTDFKHCSAAEEKAMSYKTRKAYKVKKFILTKMSAEEKELSFMNRIFVFQKKKTIQSGGDVQTRVSPNSIELIVEKKIPSGHQSSVLSLNVDHQEDPSGSFATSSMISRTTSRIQTQIDSRAQDRAKHALAKTEFTKGVQILKNRMDELKDKVGDDTDWAELYKQERPEQYERAQRLIKLLQDKQAKYNLYDPDLSEILETAANAMLKEE